MRGERQSTQCVTDPFHAMYWPYCAIACEAWSLRLARVAWIKDGNMRMGQSPHGPDAPAPQPVVSGPFRTMLLIVVHCCLRAARVHVPTGRGLHEGAEVQDVLRLQHQGLSPLLSSDFVVVYTGIEQLVSSARCLFPMLTTRRPWMRSPPRRRVTASRMSR